MKKFCSRIRIYAASWDKAYKSASMSLPSQVLDLDGYGVRLSTSSASIHAFAISTAYISA
jgi:hypothetical protein